MTDTPVQLRSRYYDALLNALDHAVQPEISSDRAKFVYAATRRMLTAFAVASERVPHLPEHFAPIFADAGDVPPPKRSGDALRDALMSEAVLLDAIEEKTWRRLSPPPGEAGTDAPPPPLTAAVVQAALQSRLGPDTSVRQFNILAGGRSKQTILLTLEDGQRSQVERVIRRDLLVGVTDSTVLEEFAVLVAVADRGLRVPRPLFLEADASVLGSAYMLMEKVEGATAGDVFDAPASREKVLSSARELARLHAIAADEIAPTLRDDRRTAPDAARLLAEISALQKGWNEQCRAPSATLDAVFAWLRDNVTAIEWQRTVVHGDYSFHNIMFDGEGVSAVMDWELVRIGHPAEDLGYIRAAVMQRMPWADFMADYVDAGGQAPPQRTMWLYAMLAKLRLMALLLRARGYFEAGYTDDLQIADVCVHHMARLIHQLSVEARAAYGLSN